MKRYLILLIISVLVLTACQPLPPQMIRASAPQGQWFPATITLAGAADNTTTGAVDLGADYQYLNIYVPTITSSAISIKVSDSIGGTYATCNLTASAISLGTGSQYSSLTIGGYRYVKVVTSAAQEANRTFLVKGYTP
jgi:hypothetical protein